MQNVLYKGRPADEAGRLDKELRVYDFLDELGIEYDAAYGIIKALVEGKLTVPKRTSGETEEAAG